MSSSVQESVRFGQGGAGGRISSGFFFSGEDVTKSGLEKAISKLRYDFVIKNTNITKKNELEQEMYIQEYLLFYISK